AQLVLSLLEAYALVTEVVAQQADAAWERDALVKQAVKKARADHADGQLNYYETLSKPTFKNTVRLLEDWAAIERIPQPKGKKASATVYQISADWGVEKINALQTRLRTFL